MTSFSRIDLKNAWKGIRNLMSMNNSVTFVPTSLSKHNDCITNPIKYSKHFQ